jgi:isocitrate dehydrogenase (NAD+)
MAMQAVLYPSRYDVVVTTNLFGDILSDLGAALVGGLGIVPSANIGDDCAIFEAVHGSAPDIAGQGLANPTALLQSAILMLHHLGKHEVANAVEAALFKTILEPQNRTRDLGGNAHTMEFANTVVKNLV